MRYYVTFNSSGKVTQYHTTNMPVPSSPDVIETDGRKNIYVDVAAEPKVVMDKLPMPLILTKTSVVADATDEGLIDGVPNPSTVTWPNGVVTQETDGDIRFTLDLEGTFQIKIESLEYITEVVDVSATPAT